MVSEQCDVDLCRCTYSADGLKVDQGYGIIDRVRLALSEDVVWVIRIPEVEDINWDICIKLGLCSACNCDFVEVLARW